jgi:flagellar hook protein FlgE
MIPTIRNALKMATSELNIVSNNIANAGSTGFKRSDGNFLHSYAEDIPIPGKNVGFGVVHEAPRRADSKQGALKVTNNSLDLAVSGVGMLITANQDDGGITYTRDGSLLIDSAGLLTTTDKRAVLDENGERIIIPPQRIDEEGRESLLDSIAIDNRGGIKLAYGDGTIVAAGNVGLARFGNISGLKSIGNAQFVVTETSGPPIVGLPMEEGYGQIIQGHLESSNAVIADELVKLMRAQQAYAGSSRLLQSAVEMAKRLSS